MSRADGLEKKAATCSTPDARATTGNARGSLALAFGKAFVLGVLLGCFVGSCGPAWMWTHTGVMYSEAAECCAWLVRHYDIVASGGKVTCPVTGAEYVRKQHQGPKGPRVCLLCPGFHRMVYLDTWWSDPLVARVQIELRVEERERNRYAVRYIRVDAPR